MAMIEPFFFGPKGQQLTPGQVKILRELAAEKVASQGTPKNLGEGLASVGNALLYNTNMAKANEAESAGQAQVMQALADARAKGGADGYYDVLGNPWASEGQRLVAGSLLDRGYALEDRNANWAHDDSIAQRNRDWQLQDVQDERDYNAPVRDAELEGANIQNETGRFNLDQARTGYTPLVTPEDRGAFGIDPADTSVWYKGPDGRPYNESPSGGQTINVNTGDGTDSALNKKLSEKEGEDWAGYKAAATVSGANTQDFELLGQLMQMAPQGPIVGPLAETFKGFSSAADAAQSIIKRVAPTLRAPGSGSTSDIEYQGMLDSLPSLKNTPEGNAMILEMMQAKAAINIERGKIITQYQNGEISVGDARRKMDELNSKSIMTPEVRKALSGISDESPSKDDAGSAPEGVDPELWAHMTPEERALWQK